MPKVHDETAFEDSITAHLLDHGYEQRHSHDFDLSRYLFVADVLAYIKDTQPDDWAYVERIQKDKTAETLLNDLCRALDDPYQGCLSVLRHGFKCFGKRFKVVTFTPATNMNPTTQQHYAANRVTVTRQLRYDASHGNELDLVLAVNGIPVLTAELKNPFTNQTWRDAVNQYKHDRNPNDGIFQFGRRSLVHFAVDTDAAYMTTKLAKGNTRFLPFNKGDGGGSGNPPNPSGHKTAYLWEEVWQRDSLLEILGRFMHLAGDTMIFPRYHQLDCVRRLVADSKERGAGKNYLVQHSAGSGKSNSIAWLAYRLSSLHDAHDTKVFNSVIVITDRVVLDAQLQETIYQFEHKAGVVHKIDKHSTQLAEALTASAPIIITTLQKFPFVTDKMADLPNRNYAVIIDEAHSSQGGETATDLKGVLGGEALKEAARQEAAAQGVEDYQEEILRQMAKRGQQENISFFAFTATPKYKTLEVFGDKPEGGKPQPFHLYSMRQAIEEGFILDVLANYMTYKTYFQLVKAVEDDPEVDKRQASKQLARFMSLHPYNLAQKTEVMIEHFRAKTRYKINGQAKAMVVCSSRLHAVRYKQAFDKYLTDKNYHDIRTLVAFSGTVPDPELAGVEYTETGMNIDSKGRKVKEKELPERFSSPEFQVLLVAEKYQTGFDQPLLHTMFVDKRLDGIQAVQTLSRLNRTHPLKEDTFVLDFINEPEAIKKAFQPFYEQTHVDNQVDYSKLYELQSKLMAQRVMDAQEIDAFAKVFYQPKKKQTSKAHKAMNAPIDAAVTRFAALPQEQQGLFRDTLKAYVRLYAFLAQVIPFADSELEMLYSFGRFLLKKLPKDPREPDPLGDDVKLEYYRLEKISEGAITLETNTAEGVSGPGDVGTGKAKPSKAHLSELVDNLNERFGTDFKPSDQLFFDAVREDAVSRDEVRQAAQANTLKNFGLVFRDVLKDLFTERVAQNEDIAKRFMNEGDFQDAVSDYLLQQVYEQARGETQDS